MAATLQLIRHDRTWGMESTLDLLNNTDGFNLAYGGWVQAIATGNDPENVQEAMTLRVQGSSHNDVSTKCQSLDDKLKEAEWYFDETTERYAVWLRTKLKDESNIRQALVRRGAGQLGSCLMAPPTEPGNMIYSYALALERFPWWEPTSSTIRSGNNLDCLGGTWEYSSSGTVVGNAPARVVTLTFNGVSASYQLAEAWIGFRTSRFGTYSEFVPVWDLGLSGATRANSTTRQSDSTAYGNYKSQVSGAPADTSMVHRCSVRLSTATDGNDPYAQRGVFNVLLRAKTASSTVWRTRLLDGFSGTSNWRTQDRVKIDGDVTTSWFFYPIGTVTIPPFHGKHYLENYTLRLGAEQASGSGALDLDCLVLIPTAEGSIHVDDAAIQAGFYWTSVITDPDGKITAWMAYSPYLYSVCAVNPQNFALPTGNGIAVMAVQRSTEQNKNDKISLNMSYRPHWRTLRGGE